MDKSCIAILSTSRVRELVDFLKIFKNESNSDIFLVDYNSSINNKRIFEVIAKTNGYEILYHEGSLTELKSKLNDLGYNQIKLLETSKL